MEYNYEYNEYFNQEDKNRLSRMLLRSRDESGMSQEKLALELGIAKKTVQNWEKGISCPSLPQAIAWFKALNVPAMPYFLQYMFPDIEGTSSKDSDEKIRKELIEVIESMPPEVIRQLMYLFYGNHGSSPRGIMNLLTAHLQTPLRNRYSHAVTILSDYKLSSEKSELSKPSHVQPNVELLEEAIESGREAIIKDRDSYYIHKGGWI